MILRCFILSALVAGGGLACSIPDDPFPVLETPPPPPDGEPAPPDGEPVLPDAEPVPPDSAAFAVLSVTPGDGATGVARDVEITVQFSAAVDPATIEHLRVDDAAGAPVLGAWSASDATVTFTPDQRLGRVRRYAIGASTELRDVAGRPLSTALAAGFTTRDGAWSAPVMAQSDDVYSAWDPRVVCHADGTVELAWTQRDQLEASTRVVVRRHGAQGWGDPIAVSPIHTWLVDLAANRRGGAVAMWLDNASMVGASRLRAGSWRALATRGLPYSPAGVGPKRVGLSEDDDMFLLWAAGLGPMAARYTTDEGWDSDVPLRERITAVAGDLAVSAQGRAAAVWVDLRGLVSRVFDPGPIGGWRDEVVHTPEAADPSIGTDANGNLILVWWRAGEVLAQHREASGIWQVIGSLGRGDGPRLVVDASGTAIATWWAEWAEGLAPRLVARLYRPGAGWDAPRVVELGGYGPYRVAVAGEEVTVIGTVDDGVDPLTATLWSARNVGGQWQRPTQLDASAVNASASVAACSDGSAAAVWSRHVGEGQGTIWMSRFE